MNSLSFVRMSSFVSARVVTPFIFTAYFSATRSSQPTLLGLPVVAPYSLPVSLMSVSSFP